MRKILLGVAIAIAFAMGPPEGGHYATTGDLDGNADD